MNNRNLPTFQEISKDVKGMSFDVCLDNLWMEVGTEFLLPDGSIAYDVRGLDIRNSLIGPEWEQPEEMIEKVVDYCRNSDYLHFLAKYILNLDLFPFQMSILDIFWNKPLPMLIATRGGSKTFMMAVYIVLRALLHQGCKICIVSASFRQAITVFNYVVQIWDSAPVLRDIVGIKNAPKKEQHACSWNCGLSKVMWLPLGDGSTIRGQRANVVLCDEFQSVDPEIFETVVRGFAATKSDGTFLNVVKTFKDNVAKTLGSSYGADFVNEFAELEKGGLIPTMLSSNQIILGGTAWYQFNHFYKYFCDYRDIITGEKSVEGMDKSDYAVIRLPYNVIPPGMMDQTILSQGRATMDPQIFNMEYGTIFPKDSDGFYLASTLNNATCPVDSTDGMIDFGPALSAPDMNMKCVMGVDPASEDDNFAINIIFHSEKLRGVLYQWTTNRKQFEELKRDGLIHESIKDYNTFCIKQIRSLARRFNVALIVMDSSGGGVSIREGLKDPDKLLDGVDQLILDMDDENVTGLQGNHILKMVQFSNSEWRVESHYGLKKDLVDLKLLFPSYDPAALAAKSYIDDNLGRMFDTIDDCYYEIEQCKKETTLIRHDRTANGTEKWDLPKIFGMDAEAVRKAMKRDRFTSLLLANWGCRYLDENILSGMGNYSFGGTVGAYKNIKIQGTAYIGPGANKMRNNQSLILQEPQHKNVQFDVNRRVYY